ncbi:hypothetical protein ACLX1H_002398 [Fusarium chlamydosporum]
METLYPCIDYANKYDWGGLDTDVHQFYIQGVEDLVGVVPNYVANSLHWDLTCFHLPPADDEGRIDQGNIYLRTDFLTDENGHYDGIRNITKSCGVAFDKLINDNRDKPEIFPSLCQWISTSHELREYSPIHLLQDVPGTPCIPSPLRGFLGVLTVGVHLNVYSRNFKGEYRIWVSHRAIGFDLSYSGMLDQIVAGGVNIEDQIDGFLAPCETLIREAEEEAGLKIDRKTQDVFTSDTTRSVGKVKRVSWITFFDRKDENAGHLNKDQLEPGLRVIYDLEVTDPNFRPQARETGIERFEAMNVPQVKTSLLANRWKPNCGLVMLDFLIRHNLTTIHDDKFFSRIVQDLRPDIPFSFSDRYREKIRGW